MANSKEWVSMKEALALSGMKSGTFTYYVAKNKIRRQEGEGQRDHIYNRADILKLAKDRTPRNYPSRRGDKPVKPVIFDWIRPSDIGAVLQLDYEVYQENYIAEAGRYESWRVKNPELSMAAFDASNRKVCLGYVGLLPLDESLILAILRGEADEKDITADDIQTFDEPGGYSMLANSAVIHPDRPDLLYKILYRITRAWLDRYPERYMRKIYAQAVSDQGERVVQNFFMMPRYDLAYNAYEIDMARPPRARLLVEFRKEMEKIAPLPPGLHWPPTAVTPATSSVAKDAPVVEVASSRITVPRQKSEPASTPVKSTLPPGYVAFRHFVSAHGVSENTVKNAINSGRLAAERGEWLIGKSSVRNAFNEEQRWAFVALYHTHPKFHQCDDPACVCHETQA